MKPTRILTLAFSVFSLIASAQNARYESIMVGTTNTGDGGCTGIGYINIGQGEAGELVSVSASDTVFTTVEKDGQQTSAYAASHSGYSRPIGTIVKGPARFKIQPWNPGNVAHMTLKITPDTYDVNKTLILPPTTNQVYVTLESSTNLVNWADATNGLYGSPDVARFFRIRMGTPASR